MALVEAAPATVTTDELVERAWDGRIVGNETVTQRVRLLRQALGDDAQEPRYVAAVRGEGYRLLPAVEPLVPGEIGDLPAPRARPWPRFLLAILALVTILGGILSLRPSASPAVPTVAVLPFRSLSTDPDHAFFARGLTTDLVDRLTRIESVRIHLVAANGSREVEAPQARAAELGADHALEGLVDWDGSVARIWARLVRARDGETIWSGTYRYAIDDRFLARAEISRAVSDALRLRLAADRDAPFETENVLAYAQYLRARELMWQPGASKKERAIEAYLEALRIDPSFVRAWVYLAYAYGMRSWEPSRREEGLRQMADASARAAALAPEHWQVHALRAWVHLSQLEFTEAERTMDRALRLRGSVGPEWECPVVCFHWQLGRYERSLEEGLRMREIEPFSRSAQTWKTLLVLGRRDEAVAHFREFEDLRPAGPLARAFRTDLAILEDDAEAMNARLEGTELEGLWGQNAALLAAIREHFLEGAQRRRDAEIFAARYAAIHGDPRLALELLRREFGTPGFGQYFRLWDPALASVRALPEFGDFLTELGLVDAWRHSGQWGDFCAPEEQGAVRCW